MIVKSNVKDACARLSCQPTTLYVLRVPRYTVDDASVVCFRFMHPLGRPLYVGDVYLCWCTERSEVRVTVSVIVFFFFFVSELYVGWWREGRRWKLLPARSLLLPISTNGTTRRNVQFSFLDHQLQLLFLLFTLPNVRLTSGQLISIVGLADEHC